MNGGILTSIWEHIVHLMMDINGGMTKEMYVGEQKEWRVYSQE